MNWGAKLFKQETLFKITKINFWILLKVFPIQVQQLVKLIKDFI